VVEEEVFFRYFAFILHLVLTIRYWNTFNILEVTQIFIIRYKGLNVMI